MKGETPDKIKFSAFSFSLLFHHFPACQQRDNYGCSFLGMVQAKLTR
jgi:hypothetical protein